MAVTVRNMRTGASATYNDGSAWVKENGRVFIKTNPEDKGSIASFLDSADIIIEFRRPCEWTPPQIIERSDDSILRDALAVLDIQRTKWIPYERHRILSRLKKLLSHYNARSRCFRPEDR